MNLIGHWTLDPFAVIAVVLAVLHEIGLRRLSPRLAPARRRLRRRRSLYFYGGLVLLIIGVASPVNYWAYRYFYVHMIAHILIMFLSPMLVVAGQPWIPFSFALPVDLRRRIGRAVALSPRTAPLRRLWRFASAPWTAILLFNGAMVFWHIPGPFDLAQRTTAVYVWLMHGSFLVAGLLFWLQIIPSRPFHQRASIAWQMGAIISSNVVMFILAMAMSIFTTTSWYTVYEHVPGVTLSPFADQQIGAAILWVCGDFWAIPSLVSVIRRVVDNDGTLSEVIEGMLTHRRTAALSGPSGVGSRGGAASGGGLFPFDEQLGHDRDDS